MLEMGRWSTMSWLSYYGSTTYDLFSVKCNHWKGGQSCLQRREKAPSDEETKKTLKERGEQAELMNKQKQEI